jgi:hypothetical protein
VDETFIGGAARFMHPARRVITERGVNCGRDFGAWRQGSRERCSYAAQASSASRDSGACRRQERDLHRRPHVLSGTQSRLRPQND